VEYRLFEEGTIPEWTRPEWYSGRERAPHLEQEMHQGRLNLSARFVRQALNDFELTSVVDLGAGDGGLLQLLASAAPRMWGYDLQQSNVEPAQNERGVDVRYGDVVTGDIEWGDVAIATEMLEHLLEPHQFVQRIAEHSKVLVASSPWNESPGSAYGFHTYAWDQDGYAALLRGAGFEIQHHQTTGMFQVIMGVKS